MKAATIIGVRLDWHILELLDKLTVRLGVNRSAASSDRLLPRAREADRFSA